MTRNQCWLIMHRYITAAATEPHPPRCRMGLTQVPWQFILDIVEALSEITQRIARVRQGRDGLKCSSWLDKVLL